MHAWMDGSICITNDCDTAWRKKARSVARLSFPALPLSPSFLLFIYVWMALFSQSVVTYLSSFFSFTHSFILRCCILHTGHSFLPVTGGSGHIHIWSPWSGAWLGLACFEHGNQDLLIRANVDGGCGLGVGDGGGGGCDGCDGKGGGGGGGDCI